jgi:hypothetical protein
MSTREQEKEDLDARNDSDPSTDERHPLESKKTAAVVGPSVSTPTRVGLVPVLPALISSLLIAGIASLLLGWLLSHRVTDRPAEEDAFFRSAIVAAEGGQENFADSLSQLLGISQQTDSGAEAKMYGLAMSSAAVSLLASCCDGVYLHCSRLLSYLLLRLSSLASLGVGWRPLGYPVNNSKIGMISRHPPSMH